MNDQALILHKDPKFLPSPTDSLEAYLHAIQKIPLLTQEEEHQLALRLSEHGDLQAAQQLVISHLRFVAHIARSYSGYGLPLGDLIQEGNIGLMKAVRRFDPDRGVRLVSFAVHWIRAEIHEFILRNWRIVKVATTKAQRKLFFNLRSSKQHLGWFTAAETEALAKELGVSTDEVTKMESRMSSHDVAFDVRPGAEDDEDSWHPGLSLSAEGADPAQQVEAEDWERWSSNALIHVMSGLDQRSRDILQRRWLDEDKPTLHELAEEYGVSAERIRQIESAAMKKLRVALQMAA